MLRSAEQRNALGAIAFHSSWSPSVNLGRPCYKTGLRVSRERDAKDPSLNQGVSRPGRSLVAIGPNAVCN